jgi:hypothetical protein
MRNALIATWVIGLLASKEAVATRVTVIEKTAHFAVEGATTCANLGKCIRLGFEAFAVPWAIMLAGIRFLGLALFPLMAAGLLICWAIILLLHASSRPWPTHAHTNDEGAVDFDVHNRVVGGLSFKGTLSLRSFAFALLFVAAGCLCWGYCWLSGAPSL